MLSYGPWVYHIQAICYYFCLRGGTIVGTPNPISVYNLPILLLWNPCIPRQSIHDVVRQVCVYLGGGFSIQGALRDPRYALMIRRFFKEVGLFGLVCEAARTVVY